MNNIIIYMFVNNDYIVLLKKVKIKNNFYKKIGQKCKWFTIIFTSIFI